MSRRRFKRAKHRRRRRSLSASVWGPILKLLAVILVFLALLYAIFYVVIPKAADFMGWDYRPPFAFPICWSIQSGMGRECPYANTHAYPQPNESV